METPHPGRLSIDRLRTRQPRPRYPRREPVRRDARLLPGGTRYPQRSRALDRQGGGLPYRLQHDDGTAGCSRQGGHRCERRRGRHPRLCRCVRSEVGQTSLALSHDSRPWRAGHDTWSGDAWKTGGGSTWVTGAYDPETNVVYWGVGNPGPDWNGDPRPGDNLYTCSLLALDGATGALKWYFQFTPHDTHDWDSAHVPVLFDAEIRGRQRKIVAIANRNAFYYVLDRSTGEFLAGRAYAKQTWAKGLDDRGKPVILPNSEPTEEGSLIWPNLNGATIWFSPSYSPLTNLFYVAVREVGSTYYKRTAEYKPGTFFAGGGEEAIPTDDQAGFIRALDPATGHQKWEFRLKLPPWAGVMSTAGGLVFGGSFEGIFFALDAATGKPLWDFQTGSSISANPVSFNIDGKQHVAIAADRVLYVFGL